MNNCKMNCSSDCERKDQWQTDVVELLEFQVGNDHLAVAVFFHILPLSEI